MRSFCFVLILSFCVACSSTAPVSSPIYETSHKPFHDITIKGEGFYHHEGISSLLRWDCVVSDEGQLSVSLYEREITEQNKIEILQAPWPWEEVSWGDTGTILTGLLKNKEYCSEGSCDEAALRLDLEKSLSKFSFLDVYYQRE